MRCALFFRQPVKVKQKIMSLFSEKIAIITGASQGIGFATSSILASRGARVVMTGTRISALEKAAEHIRRNGGEVIATPMDLSNADSIKSLINTTIEQFGRIDILHNNAADLSVTRHDLDIECMDLAVWDHIFNVNVRGTMLCCKYTLPHMATAGKGVIINTASAMGVQGASVQAAYSASKAAIIQMTRSIATSHGKRGIRCNAVLPGITRTQGAAQHLPPFLFDIQESENLTPYIGAPEDIGHIVAFLASDEARYITGQAILADGGASAHISGFAQINAHMASQPSPPPDPCGGDFVEKS